SWASCQGTFCPSAAGLSASTPRASDSEKPITIPAATSVALRHFVLIGGSIRAAAFGRQLRRGRPFRGAGRAGSLGGPQPRLRIDGLAPLADLEVELRQRCAG